MTVRTIVTQPAKGSTAAARARRMDRLGALGPERLYLSLAFLADYRPRVFDAALDATEPCAGGEPDPSREPETFCTLCGADAGIFWLLGEEWRHYRPGTRSGEKPEVYDPGHTPVIGWRTGGSKVPAIAVVPVPAI